MGLTVVTESINRKTNLNAAFPNIAVRNVNVTMPEKRGTEYIQGPLICSLLYQYSAV